MDILDVALCKSKMGKRGKGRPESPVVAKRPAAPGGRGYVVALQLHHAVRLEPQSSHHFSTCGIALLVTAGVFVMIQGGALRRCRLETSDPRSSKRAHSVHAEQTSGLEMAHKSGAKHDDAPLVRWKQRAKR